MKRVVEYMRTGSAAVLALLLASCAAPAERSHSGSFLITSAQVMDGTGAPGRFASVRVEGERIAAVGELAPLSDEPVVDARGLVLAPGFIDTHSHHDIELLEQRAALAAVSQGITTIIVGQDGMQERPIAELFASLERAPAAVNVATLAGHNTIRAAVLGEDARRAPTPAEIERMRALLREAMAAGALGLSTGLEYDPGIYSTKQEVIELAGEAARFGGRYVSHIRSEDRLIWEALEEIVEIGRIHRMPVHVSHMKLAMVDWWGQAQRFLAVLDRARAQGVEVSGDVYPYEHWQSSMTVLFPERDFSDREAAQFALRSLVLPEDLIVATFGADPSVAGKTLAQIAAQQGADPATTLLDLIAKAQAAKAPEQVIARSMDPRDIAQLLAWSHTNVCTDGSLDDAHPRGAGAFTRVLREYVRERRVLTLEEAVRKMSGAAAAHMGIEDRGLIREGAYADLVLLDPAAIADRATLAEPHALSVGVEKVWVNGRLVFAGGAATGIHSGRVVRRATAQR